MKNEFARPIQFIKDEHGFLVGREYADELKLNQRTMTPLQQRFLDAIEKHIALEGSQYDDAIRATTACEKIAEGFAGEFAEWLERGMWTMHESRQDNRRVQVDGWYNTYNFKAMENPPTTAQLIQQFKEQSK